MQNTLDRSKTNTIIEKILIKMLESKAYSYRSIFQIKEKYNISTIVYNKNHLLMKRLIIMH